MFAKHLCFELNVCRVLFLAFKNDVEKMQLGSRKMMLQGNV